MADNFISQYIEDLLKNIRTQVTSLGRRGRHIARCLRRIPPPCGSPLRKLVSAGGAGSAQAHTAVHEDPHSFRLEAGARAHSAYLRAPLVHGMQCSHKCRREAVARNVFRSTNSFVNSPFDDLRAA